MKKALALLLTMALLISGVSMLPTMAAEAVEITLPTVSGNPGDTVDVPITLDTKATGGIVTVYLSVTYDDSQLELVAKPKNGDMFVTGKEIDGEDDESFYTFSGDLKDVPYLLQFDGSTNKNRTGRFTLATMKFKIKETAQYAADGYTIKVKVDSLYDFDQVDTPYTVTDGKVNVNCLHADTEWKTVTPATCEGAGSENEVCKVCNAVVNTRDLPATGHSYGEWTQTTAPTCEGVGEEKRTCQNANCTAFETREIPATGHNYGAWTQTIAPTCEGAGEEKRTCQNANCTAFETRDLPATGHNYGAWTQTIAPTCEGAGEEKRTCQNANCTAFETREVAALGHDYGEWTQTIEPTCEGKGEEKHTCRRSGCTAFETREVAALGHDYGEWVETKAATYTEKGEEERKCTVCQKVETRETAVLVKEITGDKTDGLEAVAKPAGDTKLSADISFIVKNVTDTISAEDKAMILETISSKKAANAALAAVLNLQMTKNGVAYRPNGKLLVTVEVPRNVLNDYTDVKLMHVKADGSGEIVEYALNGTKATFEADGLDYYTFVGVTKTTGGSTAGGEDGNKSPLSGDSGMPALVTAVSLSALLGAALLLNKKRSAAK